MERRQGHALDPSDPRHACDWARRLFDPYARPAVLGGRFWDRSRSISTGG